MILADSNVIIFSETEEYPEHKAAVEKLSSFAEEGILINTIIISEVFHKLSIIKNPEEALKRTKNILSSKSFVYLPIEKETIEKALELTKYVLINDAIIAQHAIDSKTALFTDDVKDFKKIHGLKLIKLR